MKIVLTDPLGLKEEHNNKIKELGEVVFHDTFSPGDAETIARIRDAEIITISWSGVSRKAIESTPSLRYIIIPAVGHDWVDFEAANAAGICVVNCPTHNVLAVAEHTLGLMLAISRKIVRSNLALKQAQWVQQACEGTELRGRKLGLVGYGSIGRTVGKLAACFGMEVHHTTSQASPNELDALLASSDIVSLHLPLTEQSRYLIDERRLRLMKPSAYLINTARGAIVDPKALLAALRAGQLAGAALDVFEQEPLTATLSEEILQLVQLDQVVATPHIGYHTQEAMARLGEELLESLRACIQGRPIYRVN